MKPFELQSRMLTMRGVFYPTGYIFVMLPHAEDLLTLARFAWERGESIPADDAQPVYLRDKVATPKAR